MICPKCQGDMQPVNYEGIEVDRCANCGGVWFDFSEIEQLKQLQGSESIDAGTAEEGRKRDAQSPVHCPRDQARLIPMVDIAQPHVWFESCPVCHGVYLDAGEFSDLKDLTLLERLLPRGRSRPL